MFVPFNLNFGWSYLGKLCIKCSYFKILFDTSIRILYSQLFYDENYNFVKHFSTFSLSFLEFFQNEDLLNLLKFWEKVIDEAVGFCSLYFIFMQNNSVLDKVQRFNESFSYFRKEVWWL